jgi:prolipoprotein diacylglyceryltransferase
MQENQDQGNFLTLLYIALSCIGIGILFGAITNTVNSYISPYYFKVVLYPKVQTISIQLAAITDGIIKGFMYGGIFAVIFTAGFGMITRSTGSYRFGISQLVKTLSFICICWLIGGAFAMILTGINPAFYKNIFPVTPDNAVEMLRFAWAGGSTWGGIIGGLSSAILGVVMLRNRWHQLNNPEEDWT